MLDLRGRCCLVVGGGAVAERKISGLVAEAARVTVVALTVTEGVAALAAAGTVTIRQRAFVETDVEGAVLVLAATDDAAVNERVSEAARARGIFVNVADDPRLCDFQLPARVQRGALQLAVGSDGGAPFVVRRLRQMFERKLGAEWSLWIDAAARFRRAVRAQRVPAAVAEARYGRFFDGTVDEARMAARVPTPSEEQEWLALAAPPTHDAPAPGRGAAVVGVVSLVGAGPGDPGLVTLRGRARLLAADAVVYDRLAARALPCDLSARVELYGVGKEAGRHPVPQEEINALLVRLAREGKRVVRLKGGDPYVFGRGAEEALALSAAGVRFEVVSGVTAGIAAPASAGIAVTARGVATKVTFVTTHDGLMSQARWHDLARDPEATLVGFMGMTTLSKVVEGLIDAGMPRSTPAAVVEMGTTARQRSVFADLATLPGRVAEAAMKPPAVFVIGQAASYQRGLDWRRERPLAGQRVAAFSSAFELGPALEDAGAEVLALAHPLTPAARVVLAEVDVSAWIVSHVDELATLREELAVGPSARVCCLTNDVAERARALGVGDVVEPSSQGPASVILALERGVPSRASPC